MRPIVLSTVAAVLIATFASQAVAAPSRRPVRKESAVSEHVRNASNAVTQPSQPSWQYTGWSAPAGR